MVAENFVTLKEVWQECLVDDDIGSPITFLSEENVGEENEDEEKDEDENVSVEKTKFAN